MEIYTKYIVSLLILLNLCPSLAMGISGSLSQSYQHSSSSDIIWQLEEGWSIVDGQLVGKGPARAFCPECCEANSQSMKFNLTGLEGELHADININKSDLYEIAFVNSGNGSLSTYLIKQVDKSGIGNDTLQSQSIPYNSDQEYQAEIVNRHGLIQVYLSQKGQLSYDNEPLLDYYDSNPLPPGDAVLEVLEDSNVKINDLEIVCRSQSSAKPDTPNLGVGYFKRPT